MAQRRHLAHRVNGEISGRLHRCGVIEQLGAVRLAYFLEHPADASSSRLGVGVEDKLVGHGSSPALQYMCWPPLTDSVEPVMKSASSATRNSTVREMSSALPRRPTGIRATIFSSTSFGTARTISVST